MIKFITIFFLLLSNAFSQAFNNNPTDSICRGAVTVTTTQVDAEGDIDYFVDVINYLHGGIPPTQQTLLGAFDSIEWSGSPTSFYIPVSGGSPNANVDCRVCICTSKHILMTCGTVPGTTIKCYDPNIIDLRSRQLLTDYVFKGVAKND